MLAFIYSNESNQGSVDKMKSYISINDSESKTVLRNKNGMICEIQQENVQKSRLFARRNGLHFAVLQKHPNLSSDNESLGRFLYDCYYPAWKENCSANLLTTLYKSASIFDDVSAVRKKKTDSSSPPTRDGKIKCIRRNPTFFGQWSE